MTNQEILAAVANAKKGRYISLTKKKELGNGVTKQSDMVVRLGVAYANMAINEGKQTGSLPWGKWVEGLENLVVEHKGNYYLRVTAVDPAHLGNGAEIIETRYYDGEGRISREEATEKVGAEKKIQSKAAEVYNIKFENILKIGN